MSVRRCLLARPSSVRSASTIAVRSVRGIRKFLKAVRSYILLTLASPKTSKYPDGYPGDTVEEDLIGQGGRKPIQTEVSNPTSRGKRPEDQAAIESVEARMKSLDISSQASAA